MGKYQQWWDSLPKHTQQYLQSQPLWHDRDLFKALAAGVAIGFVLGALIV
jgi:hypothetical protein